MEEQKEKSENLENDTTKTEEKKEEVKAPAPTINYEDLIAKARMDEKNKLYPEIDKWKKEADEKTEKINTYLISIAEKDELIKNLQEQIKSAKEEGAKEVGEANESTKKEFESKIADLEKQLKAKDDEFTAYKTQQELASYKAEKLKDVDETVFEMVSGNTKEEIDASVEKAKAFYEKVASKFGGEGQQEDKKPTGNKAPLPKPNLGNLEDIFKNVTEEQILQMSPKEYAEFRKSVGMK